MVSWSFLTNTQNSLHGPSLGLCFNSVILGKNIFSGVTPMLPKQVCLIGHHEGDYLKSSTKAEVGGGTQVDVKVV